MIRVAACSPQIRPRYWGSRRQTHRPEHPQGNGLMLRDLRPPIVYWGYEGIMENKMETTIVYWGYIRVMENRKSVVSCGYVGIMEKKWRLLLRWWGISVYQGSLEFDVAIKNMNPFQHKMSNGDCKGIIRSLATSGRGTSMYYHPGYWNPPKSTPNFGNPQVSSLGCFWTTGVSAGAGAGCLLTNLALLLAGFTYWCLVGKKGKYWDVGIRFPYSLPRTSK